MVERAIDWQTIRDRVEAATAVVSGAKQRSPEEVRRVLVERARVQAKPAVVVDEGELLEVVVLALAHETYAIETRHVREVCQLAGLTVIPCTPPFIAGVTNLRGEILPVVDLRKLFDLPAKGLTELNRVVVLHGDGVELGLLADAVLGVRSIPVRALQAGLPTLTGMRERFLRGVTAEAVVVLDGARLLSDASLRVDAGNSKR